MTAGFITTVAFTGMNGWKNGYGKMRSMPFMTAGFFTANCLVWYQVWTRSAGYSEQKFYEFQYARVHKMLRNAEIKHDK